MYKNINFVPFLLKIFTNNYISGGYLSHTKMCHIEKDSKRSGIPNPDFLNPDLGTGFWIYKSRGIGIRIPLGTNMYVTYTLTS
jgi:hypothetical protein